MPIKIQFYPLDVVFGNEKNEADGNTYTIVSLYGKTVAGDKICVVDKSFRPYFYVEAKNKNKSEELKAKLATISVESKEGRQRERDQVIKLFVANTELVEKKSLGKQLKLVKVYVNTVQAIKQITDLIKANQHEFEQIEGIYEDDINFARRYLIDKNISPCMLAEAECDLIGKSKVPVFNAQKIKSIGEEFIQDLKILALDIETYVDPKSRAISFEKNPIIMISFYGKDFQKVITAKHYRTGLSYVEFVNSEEELLLKAIEIINHYKPDIITGYNSDKFDLPYIKARCEKYWIKTELGLDYSGINIRRGAENESHITGIIHIDNYAFIKKVLAHTLELEELNLNSAAKELIGMEKGDIDLDAMQKYWHDNKPEELDELAKYCLNDSMLAYLLCEKLLVTIEEFVKLIGIPLYDVNRMGISQIVEWYLIKQAASANELVPNKARYEELRERFKQTYQGAYVQEPVPGLYHDIAVYDFRSLYPSIISAHNICPSTIDCECCKGQTSLAFEGLDQEVMVDVVDKSSKQLHWFCKNKIGFFPAVTKDIITRRVRINQILGEASATDKPSSLSTRADVLKLLANSFYGYLGFPNARWYNLECAKIVTSYGRYYIKKVLNEAGKNNLKVIYADTDSVFFLLDNANANKKSNNININNNNEKHDRNYISKFVKRINDELPEIMMLELENFYKAAIFVETKQGEHGAKKKYALLDHDGNLRIRGFETVRRNYSKIAKITQEEVLKIILSADVHGGHKIAHDYVNQVIIDLRSLKADKKMLVITTQLQQEITSYEIHSPAVTAAKRMQQLGYNVKPGIIVSYVIVKGADMISNRAKIPEEITEGEYDPEYYVEHQVIASVEKIFEAVERQVLSKNL